MQLWKYQTCFVHSVSYAILRRFNGFLHPFNGFFTPFLFRSFFFEKTHPRALDDLHCWRRNMSTQSFIKGCVCDLTKRFPHGIYTIYIYTIHKCILSLRTLLVATKSLWPFSVTLFIQIQLIILFLATKKVPPIPKKCSKTNIIVVCTQNQKFLKQQMFFTQLSSQV